MSEHECGCLHEPIDSEHKPWCSRHMTCTCMAPGGPSNSAAERLTWVLLRYEEARKVGLDLAKRVRTLEAALKEIAEARGLWADDAAEFQRNRIAGMVEIARAALAGGGR